jgi:hypothetical protein
VQFLPALAYMGLTQIVKVWLAKKEVDLKCRGVRERGTK